MFNKKRFFLLLQRNNLIIFLLINGMILLSATIFYTDVSHKEIANVNKKQLNQKIVLAKETKKTEVIIKDAVNNIPKANTSTDAVDKKANLNSQSAFKPKYNPIPPVQNCYRMAGLAPSPINLNRYTAGVTGVKDPTNYYRIYGRDIATIKNQMYRCGPSKYTGKKGIYAISQSRIAFDYQTKMEAGVCKVTDLKVVVKNRKSMPTWTADQYTPQYIKNHMNRFLTGINVHESGHGDIDLKYAHILYNRINGLRNQNCSELDFIVSDTYQKFVKELWDVQQVYEHKTNYGARQGGWL